MLYEQLATPVHGMGMLQLDETVFVQLALFLGLMWVLDRYLFKPVLQVIRLRKQLTDKRRERARLLLAKANALERKYGSELEFIRQEGLALRQRITEEGLAEKEQLVEEARELAMEGMALSRRELAKALLEARARADVRAREIADQVVRQILGKAAVVLALVALLVGGGDASATPSGDADSRGAAEAGEVQAEVHHMDWLELGAMVVNAGLLLLVLRHYTRRRLLEAMEARRERLVAALAESTRLEHEAEVKLKDIEARLSELDEERERVLARFREEGERLRKELLDEAREQVRRIRTETHLHVDQDLARAQITLQREIIAKAFAYAEQRLLEEVRPEEDEARLEQFIQALGLALERKDARELL